MKKGVDNRITGGIVTLLINDIVMLFDSVTGLNVYNEYNLIYIIIVAISMGFIIGKLLSKNYDKEDNYDKYFCIILGIIGLLTIILILVLPRGYKTT